MALALFFCFFSLGGHAPPNEKNEKNKANATANAKLKLIFFIQLFNYSHHSSMVGSRFQLLSAILILILLLITSLTLHVSASSPDVSPHMLP